MKEVKVVAVCPWWGTDSSKWQSPMRLPSIAGEGSTPKEALYDVERILELLGQRLSGPDKQKLWDLCHALSHIPDTWGTRWILEVVTDP